MNRYVVAFLLFGVVGCEDRQPGVPDPGRPPQPQTQPGDAPEQPKNQPQLIEVRYTVQLESARQPLHP